MGRDHLASYTKVAVRDRTVIPIRFIRSKEDIHHEHSL